MIQFQTPGKAPEGEDEIGVVLELQGETARVRLHRRSVCESCGSSSTCFPSSGGASPLVEVNNQLGAGVGDIIAMRVSETRRITASLLLFGLPVGSTIGGTLLGMSNAADPTGGAGVGAIAGLAAGLLLVHFIGKLRAASDGLRPIAIEVLGHDPGALAAEAEHASMEGAR